MNDNTGLTMEDIKQMQFMNELGIQPQYQDLQQVKSEEKFLEQLNPDKILEEIENKLRYRKWDKDKQLWVDVPGIGQERKINNAGIAEIMTRVSSLININTVYSNLDSEIIENIVIDFGIELSRFLSLKYKEFNMNVIDINKITNFCCNMVYIALRRGNEALTLRLLRTMIQSKELTTTAQQKDNKGFSLNPFKWFKGG